MNEYRPNRWVVVNLTDGRTTYQKVLASWSGSYMYGDSWKLSSSIESKTEDENNYYFKCSSGSTYICGKNNRGMSTYTFYVLHGWLEDAKTSDIKIEVLENYPHE